MIYTVTFNPAIDYVLHLTAPLAVGEINRTSDEACQFGGKGINVSGVLRELGCESIALGFTAGETGAWLERGLQLSGRGAAFQQSRRPPSRDARVRPATPNRRRCRNPGR